VCAPVDFEIQVQTLGRWRVASPIATVDATTHAVDLLVERKHQELLRRNAIAESKLREQQPGGFRMIQTLQPDGTWALREDRPRVFSANQITTLLEERRYELFRIILH
jgi:hypothetical protein